MGDVMKFPKVNKGFAKLAGAEKLGRATLKTIAAALMAAGVVLGGSNASKADTAGDYISAPAGRVFVLQAAPSILLTDGSTTIQLAQHYSHTSHASHASHASHTSSTYYPN
jgi:hypothetical protein